MVSSAKDVGGGESPFLVGGGGGQKEEEGEPRRFGSRYVKLLAASKKLRVVIIITWSLLTVLGLLLGTKFLKSTVLEFRAPVGSLSEKAVEAVKDAFGGVTNTMTTVFVIVNTKDSSSVLNNKTKRLDALLNSSVVGYTTDRHYNCTTSVASYYALEKASQEQGGDIDFAIIKDSFLDNASHPEASFSLISFQGDVSQLVKSGSDFANWLDDELPTLKSKAGLGDNVQVRASGMIMFGRDVMQGTERDLVLMDGIAFPISLAILAYMLASPRLLIFPILSIITTALVSFLIMYPVALIEDVISFAPSVMMSITVALSIDYSLFLLSRFKQESELDRSDHVGAVTKMMRTAGHTVFVSGITLTACWFGLMLFPVVLLYTVGLAVGITTLVCLALNLTLTPTLLLTFPAFFSRFGCCRKTPSSSADDDGHMQPVTSDFSYASLQGDVSPQLEDRVVDSCWFGCGSAMIKSKAKAGVISLVILAVAILLATYGVSFKYTQSLSLFLPRGSSATTSFEYLNDKFGAGRLSPYQLAVFGPKTSSELCSPVPSSVPKSLPFPLPSLFPTESFMGNLTELVTDTLLPIVGHGNHPYLNPENVLSYAYLRGQPVSYADATACIFSKGKGKNCGSILVTFAQQTPVTTGSSSTSKVQCVAKIQLELTIDPLSVDGGKWLKTVRSKLAEKSASNGYEYYLTGGDAVGYDAVTEVFGLFPRAIGVTLAFVFVFVGVSFKSFFVPLRSCISLATTLAITYGLAVLVYQHGILAWTDLPGLSNMGALGWLAPAMMFSVIIGFGLDYDIFLLTRILEYRESGLSEKDSILSGLAQTGSIITAAGLIMSIAFCGLLFSSLPALNQLSFFLVISVLVDTLLIRSVLVPCLMRLIGKLNWWPRKLP